jgi:hypothetical protein
MRVSVPAYNLEGNLERYRRLQAWHTSAFSYARTARAVIADRIIGIPFVTGNNTYYTSIGVEVTVGHASNARLGIYSASQQFLPSALVLDAGEIDCTVAGVKSIVGINITLDRARLYYLVLHNQGTPTMRCFGAASCVALAGNNGAAGQPWTYAIVSKAYGALPAAFGGAGFGIDDAPMVSMFLDS